MELKGELSDIRQGWKKSEGYITLKTEAIPAEIEQLVGKKLRITMARWVNKNKRSNDANAYYRLLVGKIAKEMNRSTNWVHNWLLGDYGQPEMIDGKIVYVPIKETAAAALDVMEAPLYHLKATSYVYMDKSGDIVRDYEMLKHSREYTVDEFSQLINGTVQEAKAVGIETLPEEEVNRMLVAMEEHYGRKVERNQRI